MRLRWGGYDFQENSVRFGWNREVVFSPVGRRVSYRYEMLVRGDVRAVGEAAVSAAVGELQDAMSNVSQDLTFLNNSGTATVHSVNSSNTLNGVQVIGGVRFPIDPPEGSKTELLNKRTFEILFRWETEAPESEIVAWDQEIIVSGGGSDFVVKHSLTGQPQAQTTSAFTGSIAIQRGRAIGWSAYPSAPLFQYSSLYHLGRESYSKMMTPLKYGRNGHRMYPIEWKYYFWIPATAVVTSPSVPVI